MFFRRWKAKKWVAKISNKNMKTATPVSYEQYVHPTDRIALTALKKIPLFDKVAEKFYALIDDPELTILDMSSKIRITEKQLPRVYYMVQSICKKLGIDIPKLYLELDRNPNAYTWGYKNISITIHSGLLECLEDDELYAVLAHECGHIACKHVLYHTLGKLILKGKEKALKWVGLEKSIWDTLISAPLELAFYHWKRCSELSADRAAVLCCESATPVIESMMRLSGGTTHIDREIDRDLFIAQVEDYQKLTGEIQTNKVLEYWLTHSHSHPLLAVRAYEVKEWSNTEEFKTIIAQPV